MKTRDCVRIGGGPRAGIVLLVLLAGCQSPAPPGRLQSPASGAGAKAEDITGTVRHIDLEGGFYGIVTDNGQNLDPVNLPGEFQKDGVRLEARIMPLRNRASIHMWGTPVRILELQRLSEGP